MKRTFKKVGTGFLAFIMFALSMPPVNVFATLQNPVTDLTITDQSTASTYNLDLRWTQPQISDVNDLSAIQGAASGNGNFKDPPSDYDILYRNATIPETYDYTNPHLVASGGATKLVNLRDLDLEDGSIYGFRIMPWHTHRYLVNIPGGGTTIESRRAPYSTSHAQMNEALYLTDIKVSAKGSGKQMTVEWDNPTFDGKQIFTGYRIYYTKGGSTVNFVPADPHVDVKMDDTSLIRKANNKLEFTFKDDNFIIGENYALKVEPMLDASVIRYAGIRRLNINNKSYEFNYKPKEFEYRVNDAYIRPSLYVKPEGLDYVRLYWDSFGISSANIKRLEIFKSTDPDHTFKDRIGVLEGINAREVNHWLTDRPLYKMYYQYIVYMEDSNGVISTMYSNIREYDPTFEDFAPYTPTIIPPILDNQEKPLEMDITFKAFTRPAYNDTEKLYINPEINAYIDKDIYYDIWVTDSLDTLDNPFLLNYVVSTVPATSLKEKIITDADGKKYAYYETNLKEYVRQNEDGTFEKLPLEDNKVYYIKIVGVRDPAGQTSKPAYGSHYIPPIDELDVIPQMISKPPLRIKTDEEGLEIITDKTVDIQWDMTWFESYNSKDNTWYSKIGIDSAGNIVFNDDTIPEESTVYLNDEKYMINSIDIDAAMAKIRAELATKGANQMAIDTLPLRFMDLTGKEFEVHVVEYDHMISQGGTYEDYLNGILPLDDSKVIWTPIKGSGNPEHPDFQVTTSNAPEAGELKPNTPYVIFFRPFKMKNDKKIAYFPSYVVATTLMTRDPLDVDPTVPTLIPVTSTDTTLTVKWEAADALSYELSFDELLTSYPDGGVQFSAEDIKTNGVKKYEDGKHYIYYTIKGLFPETSYHLWIRAFNDNTGTAKYSAWSNPIEMRTTEIAPPDPPKGLGLAGNTNVENYNKENDTEYKNVGKDYLIIEWLRDYLDLNNEEGLPGAYPEDGEAGGDAEGDAEFLPSPSLITTYMVKFGLLDVNEKYYIRAKTILTVSKNGDDVLSGITRSYSYTVQISKWEDFLDYIEITVPPLDEIVTDSKKVLRKESVWSDALYFNTGKDKDDSFEGDKNADTYPLPDQDFEVAYDPVYQSLKYRFRSNQIGITDGLKDNQVDERFISRLIQNRTYTYKVDLSKPYNGQPVTHRTIEIPYSIFKAFEERKINLEIHSENTSFLIPYGALATAEVKSMADAGKNSSVIINIITGSKNTPSLNAGERFATPPQELNVMVVSPTKSITLSNFAKPIDISMQLQSRSEASKNVNAFVSDKNTGGWQYINSEFNDVTGFVSFNSFKVSNFSVILKDAASSLIPDHPVEGARSTVNSLINIADMESFDPMTGIHANQFNNLIAAVSTGKSSVNINADLSKKDYTSLGKAKLLVSGSIVTFEDAIPSLIRLYELKTKTTIRDYPRLDESMIVNITSINPLSQVSFLKAEAIGAVGDFNLDPKTPITFADIIAILNIIIEDAAM